MESYRESFWADLYTSFPLLAKEIGDADLTGRTAAVLGASDGKFVIPLAAAGCQVTAVDVDPLMLYGGEVTYRNHMTTIRGLTRNLELTGLDDRCTVVEADYMDWAADATYDYVLTSGSWAYNRNLKHGLSGVVDRMRRLTAPGGYLFADYLLPGTEEEHAIDLYPMPDQLAALFPASDWRIVHNDDVGLIGESHYPEEAWHYHRYGALVVQRHHGEPGAKR
jgi:hypothetical protein